MRRMPAAGEVKLTDGALGTEYQRLGLPVGSCADFWNLDAPERVYQVTKAYADAGSDALLTTTFRANPVTLADYGRAGDTAAINSAAAHITREAAGEARLVFGDVGPSGKMLIAGEVSEEELRRGFAQQCEALVAGGVDAIALETFSDAAEARIALDAARATGRPVIVSFTFVTGRNNDDRPHSGGRRAADGGRRSLCRWRELRSWFRGLHGACSSPAKRHIAAAVDQAQWRLAGDGERYYRLPLLSRRVRGRGSWLHRGGGDLRRRLLRHRSGIYPCGRARHSKAMNGRERVLAARDRRPPSITSQ
jgi:hypothetical protein